MALPIPNNPDRPKPSQVRAPIPRQVHSRAPSVPPPTPVELLFAILLGLPIGFILLVWSGAVKILKEQFWNRFWENLYQLF